MIDLTTQAYKRNIYQLILASIQSEKEYKYVIFASIYYMFTTEKYCSWHFGL